MSVVFEWIKLHFFLTTVVIRDPIQRFITTRSRYNDTATEPLVDDDDDDDPRRDVHANIPRVAREIDGKHVRHGVRWDRL